MDRYELFNEMTQQSLHVEYRRAWRRLFGELLNWTAVDVERWESARFGSSKPSMNQLSVIQHYGIEHYIAEVLLPREEFRDWNEASYQVIFAKTREILSVPVNNLFLDKPTFTDQVLVNLDAILGEVGMSIGECPQRKPPQE